MTPYAGSAAFVNHQDRSIADYGAAYWPGTYAELRTVKTKVDPGQLLPLPAVGRPGLTRLSTLREGPRHANACCLG